MSRQQMIWVTLGIIAVVLLGSLWFFATHHYVESNHWDGLKGKAKRDPFYLTEQFLKQKGYQVTREKSYARMGKATLSGDDDGDIDTLLLTNSGKTLSATQIAEVLDWVRGGGYLLVYAGQANEEWLTAGSDDESNASIGERIFADDSTFTDTTRGSALLHTAGIAVVACKHRACVCPDDSDVDSAFDEAEQRKAEALVKKFVSRQPLKSDEEMADKLLAHQSSRYSTTLTLAAQSLTLNLRRGDYLLARQGSGIDPVYSASAKCYGDLFGLFALGRGAIGVYNSLPQVFSSQRSWWANDSIFTYDNATYLDALLQLDGDRRRVLWYESAVYPSVWTVLWQYAALAMVTAGVLLLFWIWRNSVRFGSLWVEDDRKSRSLKRHLVATGHFYYRNERQNTLVANAYEQLDKAVARRIANPKQLNKKDLAIKMVDKTGLPITDIASVLERRYPQTDSDFVRLMQMIHRIRQRL